MKIAFFCSTPYQILLATNIAYNHYSEFDNDIYILNHFNGAELVSENIKTSVPLFKDVQYIDTINFSKSFNEPKILKRFGKKSKVLLNYKKYGECYFDFENKKYDEVFFSFPDILIQIALLNLHKINKKLIVNFFEDGTGGYSDDITKTKVLKKIFNKVTGSSNIIDTYDYYWLNIPELYDGIMTSENIKKIPTISIDDSRFMGIINKVFNYSKEFALPQKVIFFDQPISKFNDNTFKEVIEFSNQIFRDEFIVKLHPRNDKTLLITEDINTYPYFQLPWEIIASNSDISNKILIGFFSTALITNKIIFDEEPYIIFLFNIDEFKRYYEISQQLTQFAFNLKKLYSNPEKVYFPKTMSEFKTIISELQNKLF